MSCLTYSLLILEANEQETNWDTSFHSHLGLLCYCGEEEKHQMWKAVSDKIAEHHGQSLCQITPTWLYHNPQNQLVGTDYLNFHLSYSLSVFFFSICFHVLFHNPLLCKALQTISTAIGIESRERHLWSSLYNFQVERNCTVCT